MKTLIVTLYKRPTYTKLLLDALRECDGIEDYQVLFSVDYDPEFDQQHREILELIKGFHYTTSTFIHSPKFGIDLNKLFIFPLAFGESEYVIHLEDDVIPARDFLRYMEWVDREFADDPRILAGVAYCNAQPSDLLYEAYPSNGYCCWGWGTWRDRWSQVIGDESAYRAFAGEELNDRFDWYWKQYGAEHNMKVIVPTVARVQMIGEQDSIHMTPELYQEHFNPHGAWEFELSDRKDWTLVDPWGML